MSPAVGFRGERSTGGARPADSGALGIDMVSKTSYCGAVAGFTKLFSSLIFSTVWREDLHVKVVWITMLAMANRHGDVLASVPGLADAARVTLAQCRDALTKLAAPDPDSRTKAHEGRRIADVDGGWRLLNYEKYRAIRDADERRLQTRDAVRRHRARRKVSNVSPVSQGKPGKPGKAQAEAEAEAEAKSKAEAALRARLPPAYHDIYDGYRRAAQHPHALTAAILAEGPDTGTNGAPGKTWEVIGQALLELRAAGKPFTPALLRAFVRKLLEAPSGGATETPGDRARRRADELERAAQGGAP